MSDSLGAGSFRRSAEAREISASIAFSVQPSAAANAFVSAPRVVPQAIARVQSGYTQRAKIVLPCLRLCLYGATGKETTLPFPRIVVENVGILIDVGIPGSAESIVKSCGGSTKLTVTSGRTPPGVATSPMSLSW